MTFLDSSSIICTICFEEIEDQESIVIPSCHKIYHGLHKKCLTRAMNGCPDCRKDHRQTIDKLRTREFKLPKNWTIFDA